MAIYVAQSTHAFPPQICTFHVDLGKAYNPDPISPKGIPIGWKQDGTKKTEVDTQDDVAADNWSGCLLSLYSTF